MNIFGEIRSALTLEERVVVATIIAASGSTPAPLLSRMLVTRGGLASTGTVGGGCMEGDILLRAPHVHTSGVAEILRFTLDEDDDGMICGGTIEVLVEPVDRATLPVYESLVRCREAGEACALVTHLDAAMRVAGKAAVRSGAAAPPELPEPLIAKAFARQQTLQERAPDGLWIVELIEGAAVLVIFGGGHVSRAISRVAALTGFQVTVVDDRPKYAHPGRFPEAAETIVADFSSAAEIVARKHDPYVVIVTRGHRHDEEVLRAVAGAATGYIGMIGSRRKVRATLERLLAAGVSPEILARVHAPMGLAIGAVSPEEIAVSVVAEMIAVRRGAAGKPVPHLSAVTEPRSDSRGGAL